MKRRALLPRAISLSALLLLRASSASACQTGSVTITNLPSITGASYQVWALNASGKLTGFYSVHLVHPGRAFLYDNGTLTDLGTFGGTVSEGRAINASGQIIGEANLSRDTNSHAFLWNGGGPLLDLGTLGGPSSTASAINDAGVIVGTSDLANGGGSSAFIYTNGAMSSLGNLGGNYSSAFAINSIGVIAGESTLSSGGDLHGFIYTNGTMLDLGTLGGNYSSAFAVGDAGAVAGESATSSSETHGFFYLNGSMIDLGTFGGTYSTAYLVNSNNQAIGFGKLSDDVNARGFVYSGGTQTDLGTLGGIYSYPSCINNLGQIVGDSETDTGDDHAFLWEKGKMVDLNTLLPPDSGWELFAAVYINDAGRIVGVGNYLDLPTWFIMDLAGDNHAPVAVAGPNQTVDCQSQVTLDGSASSDADNDALSFEWSYGNKVLGTSATLATSLPFGTDVVTLKVTDPCGLSSQANVTVVVGDTTPPTGSCPAAVTVSANSSCQASVPDLTSQVVAGDNCTPPQSLIITQSPVAGTLVGLGPHTVTMTVTDASGNASSCDVLFTVNDTTPPTILSTPAPFTVSTASNCQAQVPNVLADVVATDSCPPADQLVMTQDPVAGSLIGIGTHTIVVTATDGSGNNSSANVSFTVADTTAPSILRVPGPFYISTFQQCLAAVPNVLTAVLASDNCTPANQLVKTQIPVVGTRIGAGIHTVVVTVTDHSGNSTNVNVLLIVSDTTAPSILSVPGPIQISTGAQCQGVVPDVLAGVLASDNCTPANQLVKTQNPAAGSAIGAGIHTIVVTVTDGSGNSSNANVLLTVSDTTAPSILSVPGPLTIASAGHCQGTVPNVLANVVATDNCTPADQLLLTQTPAAGTVLSTGQNVITVTVTDASGNAASAGVPLTIADTSAPVIQSLSASPNVLTPPNHQLVPVTVSAVVSDNCDAAPVVKIVSVTCSEPCASGDIQIAGDLTVTLAASKDASGTTRVYTITVQATDVSGNSSSGLVTVTVPKSSGNSSATSSVMRGPR